MSSRSLGCLLAVLAASGCSGEPGPDGIQSGSRLRARFLQDGEGARAFQTFHDRELGIDCDFRGDPRRCLPPVAITTIFRDAACTQPLWGRGVTGDACATLPSWVGLADDAPCATGPARIWRLGQRVERSEVYLVDTAGQCVTRPARIDYEYYVATAEIPLERFVAGRYEVSGEGRLRRRVIVADDGARLPVGFVDGELAAECRYDATAGACLPELISEEAFGDAACTLPVAIWAQRACETVPRFIGRVDGELTVYERGDRVYAIVLFGTDETGACEPYDAPAGDYFFLRGSDALPRLAQMATVLGDDRRLQAAYFADEDGGLHHVGGFHDRDLGVDCLPAPTARDEWRCLPPSGSTPARFYHDALCTRPLDVLESRAPEPGQPWKPAPGIAWRPAIDDACATRAHLHEPGDELAPGSIYRVGAPFCAVMTWDPAEVRYFTLGPELPLDGYALLRRVTE